MPKLYTFILLIVIFSAFNASAQQNDSLPARRNTIKLNLVSSFIYSNSAALSYERVVKPSQSFVIMLGYVRFPELGSLGSSVASSSAKKNSGIVVGGEYRFYLKKENKYGAPRGIYLGPYVNYFNFSNDRDLTYTDPNGVKKSATLSTGIDVINIGGQLGYQFMFKDRWTIDFIFIGPSISQYALDLSLSGFNASEEQIVGNEILNALTKKFPLVKDLLTNQSANVNGRTSTWAPGFRYQMNIGYHFGRKKK